LPESPERPLLLFQSHLVSLPPPHLFVKDKKWKRPIPPPQRKNTKQLLRLSFQYQYLTYIVPLTLLHSYYIFDFTLTDCRPINGKIFTKEPKIATNNNVQKSAHL